MRRRDQNRQEDCQNLDEKIKLVERTLDDLLGDLINDSVFYCACVILKFSDDSYDNRPKNRLVKIGLN